MWRHEEKEETRGKKQTAAERGSSVSISKSLQMKAGLCFSILTSFTCRSHSCKMLYCNFNLACQVVGFIKTHKSIEFCTVKQKHCEDKDTEKEAGRKRSQRQGLKMG